MAILAVQGAGTMASSSKCGGWGCREVLSNRRKTHSAVLSAWDPGSSVMFVVREHD